MKFCKFCKKEVRVLTKGYCQSCYNYFIKQNNNLWIPSEYGCLNRVNLKEDKQFGMPICHICGRAYTKLQQHIWYSHNLTKEQYCKIFGLDKNINMTEVSYNKKMSEYAYKNNMPAQLKEAGKNTRFKKGYKSNYKRSYQTMQRLKSQQFKKVLKNP